MLFIVVAERDGHSINGVVVTLPASIPLSCNLYSRICPWRVNGNNNNIANRV